MPENLVQHRSDSSVWDQASAPPWDTERWLAAVLAGGLIVASLRQRRSIAGLLMCAGGSALAWWAASGIDVRQHRRSRLLATAWRTRWHADDKIIGDASEASFPASDAPAWTPSTGNATGPAPTHLN